MKYVKAIAPPLVLFGISLTYTLLYTFQSPYLIGADTHLEYWSFIQTIIDGRWQADSVSRVTNSCLSLTYLPYWIWKITGWNALMIYKVLYPVIASFIPVVTYYISRRYAGIWPSMLAGVMIILSMFNVWAASYARNVTSLLFMVIAIWIATGNIKQKGIYVTLMVLAVVVSYYAAGLIIIMLLIGQYIIGKVVNIKPWLPYGGLFAVIIMVTWWYGWKNPLALDVFRSANVFYNIHIPDKLGIITVIVLAYLSSSPCLAEGSST